MFLLAVVLVAVAVGVALRAQLHLAKGDEAPDAGPIIISAIELTLHRESGNKQKEEIPARAQVSRFILFIIYLFIVVFPLSLSCRAPVNAPIACTCQRSHCEFHAPSTAQYCGTRTKTKIITIK